MKKVTTRRDFSKLGAAAFAGVVASASVASGKSPASQQGLPPGLPPLPGNDNPHACGGMNSCKGQGRSGKNDCAFQGGCATEIHKCAQKHTCKFTGGCSFDQFLKGVVPGQNRCDFKIHGETQCGAVPIKDLRVREIAKCYAKLRIIQKYGRDARFAKTMRALGLR